MPIRQLFSWLHPEPAKNGELDSRRIVGLVEKLMIEKKTEKGGGTTLPF